MKVPGIDPARLGNADSERGEAELERGRQIDTDEEAQHGGGDSVPAKIA
jgi:hypothetical protein